MYEKHIVTKLLVCTRICGFSFVVFWNSNPVYVNSPGDDHQALIWDIQQMPRAIEDPILAYTAGGEINQIQWSSTQPDWISIGYNNCMEILRV